MSANNGMGGILSSQEAYEGARRLWLREIITDVSADLRGGVLEKIGHRLAAAQTAARVIYLSNAMDHMGWDWHSSEGREGFANFAGGLAALPADARTIAIVAEVGGAATYQYYLTDLINMLRVDAKAGEDFSAVRDLMSALAEHKSKMLDAAFFGFEQRHLKGHCLGTAIGQAIAGRKTITEARLKEIAAECGLSHGDIWRFLFTMRELGIGDCR